MLLEGVLLWSALAAAAVLPPPPVPMTTCFHKLSEGAADGQPKQGAGTVSSGSSLSYAEGYTFGLTWTEGVSLGIKLSKIIDLGLDFSVAESVSNTVTESQVVPCPSGGNWKCSYLIYPYEDTITGIMEKKTPNCQAAQAISSYNWNVSAPIKDRANNAKVRVELCACKNYKSWADNGAPTIVCPEDCA